MEILFQNSYEKSEELIKEVYRYLHFKRKFRVVLNVIIIVCLLVNVLSAIFYGEFYWWAFIYAFFVWAYQIFCYFSQVRTVLRRDEELNGEELFVETIVTNDFIQNKASNGAVNELEYCKVKSAAQTKNLILLRSRANLIYIFRKDSFTKGTKEEFLAFLKEKGIRIK